MHNQMKNSIQNIEPKIGLGNLKFGMAQDEVKEIIGLPKEIEIYQYLPNTQDMSENWHFEDLELSLSFSSEDEWRLDTISINSSYYSLWDKIRIGQSMVEIQQLLKQLKVNEYVCEDWSSIESPDHKLYEIDEFYLNLWFDNRVLSEIQWSPKFINENEIEWPHNSKSKTGLTEIGFKRYQTNYLFDKLENHITDNLNQIFEEPFKDKQLISEFPPNTQREDLKTENREIKYFLDMDDKVKGSILAKARMLHNKYGDIGWMAVLWENNLTLLDDFLVIEDEEWI